jgi:hypothetical protein
MVIWYITMHKLLLSSPKNFKSSKEWTRYDKVFKNWPYLSAGIYVCLVG